MVNPHLTKALLVVRAAVRLKVIMNRRKLEQLRMHSNGSLFEVTVASPLLYHDPSNSGKRSTSGRPSTPNDTSPDVEVEGLLRRSSHASAINLVEERTASIAQDLVALGSLLTASYFNILLLAVPLGFASGILGWDPQTTFVFNFLALIPLALILGDVTEDLAIRFGSIIGGLLNATFGNIVELILSIAALEKGLYTVVATSLVGSILSNMLLVLGCCFLFGGMYHKIQTFNATSNRACSSLLLLSSIGVAVPSAAGALIKNIDESAILFISRGTAIIMLACYICYLVFQLYTHSHVFDEEAQQQQQPNGHLNGDDESEELIEEPLLSASAAFLTLGAISVLVAFHSEYLTGSIEAVSQSTGLTQAFLGMIVLPIAGNACEHMAAVVVAMKNKMELSLGIAIGSSLQIALCVMPIVVLVGWATNHNMSLNLDLFIVVALLLSVVHANLVTADARSHWLMGVSLIAVYMLIAIAYFCQK